MRHEPPAPRTKAATERRPAIVRAPVTAFAGAAPTGAGLQQRLGNHGAQAFAAQVVARSSTGNASAGGAPGGQFSLSHPDDAHEREAERVADVVMRSVEQGASAPTVQRMCAECDEELSERVDRSASGGHATQVASPVAASIQSMQGGGTPLSPATRAFFEPRFGADFSHVRVHTGGQAEGTAKAISAKAFTVGADIVFAGGQYSPESQQGRHLLAHELTHVVQQDRRELRRVLHRKPSAAPTPLVQSAGPVVQRDWIDDARHKLSDKASDVVDSVSDLASDAADAASGVLDRVMEQLQSAIDTGIGQITQGWAQIKRGVNGVVDGALQKAMGFMAGIGALLGAIGNALANFDVDSLRAAWSAITGAAESALGSVRGIVAQATSAVDGLWSGLKSTADGLIAGLRGQANRLIGNLPSLAQGTARGIWNRIEAKLTSTWNTIESGWASFRDAALQQANQLVDTVASIVANIKRSVISTIIDTLDRVRQVFGFLLQLIADPSIIIDPLVQDIIDRLQALPSSARAYVQDKANENVGGAGPTATSSLGAKPASVPAPAATGARLDRLIQRAPASPRERSTVGFVDLVTGCWDAIADKLSGLWATLGKTVKEMVLSLIWPPVTWEALKKDWAQMTEELGKRAKRWEDISTNTWGEFADSFMRFLSNLADYPLIVWRALNGMLGHLSVYIGLAIVLGGAVAGAIAVATGGAIFGSVVPVAGTAAGGGLGLGAGFMAGAAAGWAAAETVGLILLVSFVLAEQLSIAKAFVDLMQLTQDEEEQKEDFGQVADSTIAIVTALLLMLIAFIGVALAKRVWAFIRSIPVRLRPKPKAVDPAPAGPRSAEPPVDPPPIAKAGKIIICRACVELKLVPPEIVARRARLSPEMQNFLDKKLGDIVRDPLNPTPNEFQQITRMMDGIEKGAKGDLEAGLRAAKAREAPAGTKPPFGDPAEIAKLPRLAQSARELLAEIQEFITKRPDATGAEKMAQRLTQDVEGVLKKMETGATQVTPERIEGFENNLKGLQTELDVAKTAPPGTKFGVKKSGQEIDRISPDGSRWINDKGGRRFGAADPRVADLEAQAVSNLKAAQLPEHLVNGKPPEIEFHFPQGVTPEAAARLRKVNVGGQSLIVTGPEIPL